MATPAMQDQKQITRPLHVLVPLIKADLKGGDEAANWQGCHISWRRAKG